MPAETPAAHDAGGHRPPIRGGGLDESTRVAELEGLDRLETALPQESSRAARLWSASWPKVAAILIVAGIWELVVLSGWKPSYVLPGPLEALKAMWEGRSALLPGAATTLGRASSIT